MDQAEIRSVAWATDIDVLPVDATATRGDGYWAIRSPSNPNHYWGNFLLFDDAPGPGDRARWETLSSRELDRGLPREHTAFAWDRTDGTVGAAEFELVPAGYELQHTVALVARPHELRPHRRSDLEVSVRPLDPRPDADRDAWAQVLGLWVAARDPCFAEAEYVPFASARLADLRALFVAGRGNWWVAELPGGEVAGSLGIVVTGPRARFQTVDTAPAHRRRGICSRLVVEAAQRTAAVDPVKRFVICADPGYHALGLYEGLGFAAVERVTAALLRREPAAGDLGSSS